MGFGEMHWQVLPYILISSPEACRWRILLIAAHFFHGAATPHILARMIQLRQGGGHGLSAAAHNEAEGRIGALQYRLIPLIPEPASAGPANPVQQTIEVVRRRAKRSGKRGSVLCADQRNGLQQTPVCRSVEQDARFDLALHAVVRRRRLSPSRGRRYVRQQTE